MTDYYSAVRSIDRSDQLLMWYEMATHLDRDSIWSDPFTREPLDTFKQIGRVYVKYVSVTEPVFILDAYNHSETEMRKTLHP